jgi:type I restriction enzyme S subunit
MTIPQGYKQTELGIIPEDWEVVNLGNIAKVNGRIGFRGYTVADLVPKGFGAITLSPLNIINNQIDYSNCTYISWYKYHESPEIKVRNGDILLVKTGSTFGKSAFVKDLPEKATINPQFVLLNNFKCDSRYLSYVIAHDIIQNQIHADIVGGAIPTLSQEKIANFTLFAPIDIAEQRAIAEALSDIDELIVSLDKKIEKKRLIKQGAMQELLTGKKRLLGFSDEWVKITFGEYVDIYRGGSPRPIESYITDSPNGVNWIKIGDVKPNDKYINKTEERIIPDGVSRSRRVDVGDFILSNSMSFGRPYILGIDGCIHDGWLVIQNYHNSFDKDYLYYLLCSEDVMMQYIGMAAGSSVKNLNKEKVASLQLCVPTTIEEQQAIATILSDMDKDIADLEVKRDKYRLIKSGMMQKLLTGQIRLKI